MTVIQLKVFLGDESHVQRDCFMGLSSHKLCSNDVQSAQRQNQIWELDCDVYVILCHIHQISLLACLHYFGIIWSFTKIYSKNFKIVWVSQRKTNCGVQCLLKISTSISKQSKVLSIQQWWFLLNWILTAKLMCPISTSTYVEVFLQRLILTTAGLLLSTTKESEWLSRFRSSQTANIIFSLVWSQYKIFWIAPVTIRNPISNKLGCYPVPYVMVQPCMLNRTEKKIVCVGGRYCYNLHRKCGVLGHEYRYYGDMEARYEQFAYFC
jgi:hypothetical protein